MSVKDSLRAATEALLFRSRLANVAGHTFGGKRNLYQALGYQRYIFPQDYRSRFMRNAVANRIVKALPKSCWRGGAEIIENEDPMVETTFEAAWNDLEARLRIWSVFQQADILAGIARYAIILIGGPGTLDTPLEHCGPDDISYLTPFSEEDAPIQMFDTDINSERFGLPIFYTVKRTSMTSTTAINSATVGRRVHWTRIIHVADGMLDDRIYGEPRLMCVWNLIDDLEKVTGGGAEAFWKRADQGMQFDIDPTLTVEPDDLAAFKTKVEEYEHGLRRTMLTRGMTINPLGSDVADFSKPVDSIISQISAGTGIPQRVLMGSEQGKLAAKMDRSNWDDRVANRRDEYCGPIIVRPFVLRLIGFGALPAPQDDFDVRWPQMNILDDEQRATIAGEWSTINKNFGSTVVTANEIRERVMDLPPLEEGQGAPSPGAGAAPDGAGADDAMGADGKASGQPAEMNVGDGNEPVAASARRKEGHVHRVADRFRTGRKTRRERLILRRTLAAQQKQASGAPEAGRPSGRDDARGFGRDRIRRELEG